MVDLQATTTVGTQTTLDAGAVEGLKKSLRGELLTPSAAGYDEARQVFNRMIDRQPALIVRCAGAADVIKAVNFARTYDLPVAVRGSGHNVVGFAVCDQGLVIDLSPMKGMRINPETHTVSVETGLTWGELNHDLQTFGLGATGGYVSITGISGLTLGGGLGWLVRKHGLACDNLLSVDIVTADGKLLTASATENQDLFWGVRGGGGNFGVVTSFEFQVHPIGTVLAGVLLYPFEKAKDLLRLFREHVATAPDELTWGAALLTAPPAPFLPEAIHGKPVVGIALVYSGTIEDGEQVVRPFREFGPPLADIVQPMPYSSAQHMADDLFPTGMQNYWKGTFLRELNEDAIDTLVANFESVPSPQTVVLVDHNGGGAISRVGEEETAFAHRGWTYNFLITSQWVNAQDSEANVSWTRKFWDAMQPFSANVAYVNYQGDDNEESVRAAYTARTRERLVALKNKYDPSNFFRLNQNIKPMS